MTETYTLSLFLYNISTHIRIWEGRRKGVRCAKQGALDFEILYFPINFLIEKCISLSFELVK